MLGSISQTKDSCDRARSADKYIWVPNLFSFLHIFYFFVSCFIFIIIIIIILT